MTEKASPKTEKEIIKEFQKFRRKNTMTCNAIRLDEVAQFVRYLEKRKS